METLTLEEFQDWYNSLPVLTYGELGEVELFEYFTLILQWKRDLVFIANEIPDNKFTVLEYWLLLGILNDECLDYGSSPRGAWLTTFGTKLLNFLEAGKHLEIIDE